MTALKFPVQEKPGDSIPCRYVYRYGNEPCGQTAEARANTEFIEGSYEGQGGRVLQRSRIYRCGNGHLFKCVWTELVKV